MVICRTWQKIFLANGSSFFGTGIIFNMFGEKVPVETSIDGPTFYIDWAKTYCEFAQISFDIITNLLRYRFKDFKLAQSLLFFLSD